jgi:ArsR family transcriptional regulator, arsenate/arsenite/antimonite-responsive transcriptional repressor / arsenate reductase (thioredoxin)
MMNELFGPADHVAERAALHRALGDENRLRIVDALQLSDRSPKELGELTGMPANLLAFHLGVLEDVGLVERTASEGDARRRYVTLAPQRLATLTVPRPLDPPAERVLFLCTANSARSQLAAHLWRSRTGLPALSAGTEPAPRVHPGAVAVAERHGLDLSEATPRSHRDLDVRPDLLVSVCDRAYESPLAFEVPALHWSVPDPVSGNAEAFASVFEDLSERVDRLARALPPRPPNREDHP